MKAQSRTAAGSSSPPDTPIYSVSELNRDARLILEDSLPSQWVSGEISNLARPGSGHLYFSLKDEHAQVRCAMFRNANRSLAFAPEDGLQVLIRAKVTIYEPRGSYQLIVEHMEPAGEGLLRRQFEALKTKLSAAGLFDESRKQPLPALPARIGVITSPTGAAIRDILNILKRRFASVPVIIYPVQVQGERAKHDIVAALRSATDRAECDLLILGRGGGSLEDLWAFNEEIVAHAISDCPIPIISAVGHEVDFTIADLVADLRAPTPSGAAELAVPDRRTWLATLKSLQQRMSQTGQRLVRERRRRISELTGRLYRRQPGYILRQLSQRLDELTQRIGTATTNRLNTDRIRLANARQRLRTIAVGPGLAAQKFALAGNRRRLEQAIRNRLERTLQDRALITARLNAVSPLKTLQRGYSIVVDNKSSRVVRDTKDLETGSELTTTLAHGKFTAIVKKIL
jgi:exodeoxyribonuclease VII large subunit